MKKYIDYMKGLNLVSVHIAVLTGIMLVLSGVATGLGKYEILPLAALMVGVNCYVLNKTGFKK
jgi:hypothetical protein